MAIRNLEGIIERAKIEAREKEQLYNDAKEKWGNLYGSIACRITEIHDFIETVKFMSGKQIAHLYQEWVKPYSVKVIFYSYNTGVTFTDNTDETSVISFTIDSLSDVTGVIRIESTDDKNNNYSLSRDSVGVYMEIKENSRFNIEYMIDSFSTNLDFLLTDFAKFIDNIQNCEQ